MNGLKAIAKRSVIEAVARGAPLTWRWRKPGSLAVLMYHRVLPQDSPARELEQPGMYVSPETLDLHLTELRRRFELVHLDDWLHRAKSGKPLPKLACAITFDDGWRDNYEFALPVLMRHGAPATIFLVSSYVGGKQRFWPNRLMTLLQKSFAMPGSVDFPRPLRLIVDPVLADARRRHQLRVDDADRVVHQAKELNEEQIRSLVEAADKSCADSLEVREILDHDEIARMASTGLIRFGSHTLTHLRLGGRVSSQELEREIIGSREQLRGICAQDVDLFCYPNGETSAAAVDLVRRHYLGSVTTRRGWHTVAGDPHLVRRLGVHEDVSDTRDAFIARLSGWV